jgi:excisionase family DNA binding protein
MALQSNNKETEKTNFVLLNLQDLENLNAKIEALAGKVEALESKPEHAEFLTLDEASDFLGYTKPSIYQLIHKGKIPHYKAEGVRGKISFKRKELVAFLEKGRKATATEQDTQAIEKATKITKSLKSKK